MVVLDRPANNQLLYGVKDIQQIFGIGKNLAYKLIKTSGFPSININGRYYIPKSKLDKWIESNTGRHIEL